METLFALMSAMTFAPSPMTRLPVVSI